MEDSTAVWEKTMQLLLHLCGVLLCVLCCVSIGDLVEQSQNEGCREVDAGRNNPADHHELLNPCGIGGKASRVTGCAQQVQTDGAGETPGIRIRTYSPQQAIRDALYSSSRKAGVR